MKILGVDEAGRGPVLGPMVMGAVVADESQFSLFRDFGVRDSKALTRKARERVYDRLDSHFKIACEIISPDDINKPGSNLNRLEFDALCRLLAKLKPDRLVVDAFMHPKKLSAEILARFPKMEVIAEWKADENHLIVSAASIVAKVTRDRQIESLKEKYGDLGSGYPGDPKTNRWLKSQLLKNRLAIRSFPACVRIRWSTIERIRREEEA